MTYLELINNADHKLSHNQITFGEYNKIIEPLRTEIPKKGKWIKVYPLGMDYEAYMCSECETGDWDVTIGEYKFCPYCGAEMEGVEDEDSD